MECGIGNKTGRALTVNVNGKDYPIECGDGVYIDIPEDKNSIIEVRTTENEEKKLLKILFMIVRFLLAPFFVLTRAESLEMKQVVGLTTRFEIRPTESISLVDSDNDFALCIAVTENRIYEGEPKYTEEELKKEFLNFIIPALLTVLGAAGYLFLVLFFIKKNRKNLAITLAVASAFPVIGLTFNAVSNYRLMKKKLADKNQALVDSEIN